MFRQLFRIQKGGQNVICRKHWFPGFLLAGIALLGAAAPARANFQVQFSYNGTTVNVDGTVHQVTVTNSTGTTTYNGSYIAFGGGAFVDTSTSGSINVYNLTVGKGATNGGFNVSASIAKSNMPGTPTVATIDMSSLSITNNSGVSGKGTLTMITGDTGFTAPQRPVATLVSTMSATAAGTNNDTADVTFNSYLDNSNHQFGTTGAGIQSTPAINLSGITAGTSKSDNQSAQVDASQIPYSLTQVERISLSSGDRLSDGSSGTSLMAPAPPGWLLACSGVPFLGAAYLRRQRRVLA